MAKANEVKYSDATAGMQRDDESVGTADLIAAYDPREGVRSVW